MPRIRSTAPGGNTRSRHPSSAPPASSRDGREGAATRRAAVLAALLMSAALCAAGCGGRYSAAVAAPASNGATRAAETGLASWYGDKYHGRRTASGEPFDMFAKTAAHRTLPFGTRVRVDNLDNGRSVTVRINDRGPFKDGRVIDLSYAAARELRMVRKGLARVRIRPIR